MTLSSVLLQASQSGLSSMLMIVAMIAIFYFVMIRPQSKKQKELKREAMQKGDRVVTAGGIHGKIRNIDEATIMVEVAPGVELKLDKASVYPVIEAAPKDKK